MSVRRFCDSAKVDAYCFGRGQGSHNLVAAAVVLLVEAVGREDQILVQGGLGSRRRRVMSHGYLHVCVRLHIPDTPRR